MKSEHNLIWIDLEMTGLNPQQDVILEIAAIITDNDLNVLAELPSRVIHHEAEALQIMDEWCTQQHTSSGLVDQVRASTLTVEQAELEVLDFVKQHCTIGASPLCGNSVYNDRIFLRMQMPNLDAFLHYRLIDVSTLKELVQRWYPGNPQAEYKKQDMHRALDDIRESIAELKHYRTHFFKS